MAIVLALGPAPGQVAAAEADPAVGPAAAATELPVSIGRPGSVGPRGWAAGGTAVPLLLVATAGMLVVGAMMLWRRCLQHDPEPRRRG